MTPTRFFPAPHLSLLYLRNASDADVARLAINLYAEERPEPNASRISRFKTLRTEMFTRRSACFASCGTATLQKEMAEITARGTAELIDMLEPARLAAFAAPTNALVCARALLIAETLQNRGF